jgi:hypothetical protein
VVLLIRRSSLQLVLVDPDRHRALQEDGVVIPAGREVGVPVL